MSLSIDLLYISEGTKSVDIGNNVTILCRYWQLTSHTLLHVRTCRYRRYRQCCNDIVSISTIYFNITLLPFVTIRIRRAHPEIRIQDYIRSHSYLACLEVVREPIMNRYQLHCISTEKEITNEKTDHESISIRYRQKNKSFLSNISRGCKGIYHESISTQYRRYRHKKKITNEETDHELISIPYQQSILFNAFRSCKGTDHESILTRYRRWYRQKITNEEGDIDRKKSFLSTTWSSCKETDHESISIWYHVLYVDIVDIVSTSCLGQNSNHA
jgi:hypothetical protein